MQGETMVDKETQQAYDHAAETLEDTRRIIEEGYPIETVIGALKRHGVAVWIIGQRGDDWQWDCLLSHKAAWGDVFYKATHRATMDLAIREAAREWIKTR